MRGTGRERRAQRSRRRCWTEEEKARVVSESFVGGARVKPRDDRGWNGPDPPGWCTCTLRDAAASHGRKDATRTRRADRKRQTGQRFCFGSRG